MLLPFGRDVREELREHLGDSGLRCLEMRAHLLRMPLDEGLHKNRPVMPLSLIQSTGSHLNELPEYWHGRVVDRTEHFVFDPVRAASRSDLEVLLNRVRVFLVAGGPWSVSLLVEGSIRRLKRSQGLPRPIHEVG